MSNPTYDYLIVGGGAAGLSLAYQLIHSLLGDRSILIIEPDAKDRNDRTFCFWSNRPMPFDDIAYRAWRRVRLVNEDSASAIDLRDYQYEMIRGLDFYQFVRDELAQHPNVTFMRGAVDRIEDGIEGASVVVGGQSFAGRWIFDSRFRVAKFKPDQTRYHSLQQHFKGWLIETAEAAFDPHAATLFDFRTPQTDELRFFYVLPLSEHEALIEFVLLSPEKYDQALRDYVENTLGIKHYRVVATEGGVSPLTDFPFERRTSEHVMTIGTPGGRVKPSSGYAFTRIQNDSSAIVQSLIKTGQPFNLPADSRLYRLCDALLLDIMSRHGESLPAIFATMFKRNPIDRVFRFLDETASAGDIVALIASMPPRPFLAALFRVKGLYPIRRAFAGRFTSPTPAHKTKPRSLRDLVTSWLKITF